MLRLLLPILLLSACSGFAQFEGAIASPELFSQAEVDAVIECSVAAGRLHPENLYIDLDDALNYKALTINENEILMRSGIGDVEFSRDTKLGLLSHELHHVDSFQRGDGGDAEELDYDEELEDSIAACAAERIDLNEKKKI